MKKGSRKISWWIFAGVAFLLFIVLQIPANWFISSMYKNNQILSNVTGNIWRGEANWNWKNLSGAVQWNTRPFDLLLLRVGADIKIHSSDTTITGILGYGVGKKLIIRQLDGQISQETLKSMGNWEWPINPIQISGMQLNYQKNTGFKSAAGQLHWGGGELTYVVGQKQEKIVIPSLQGVIKDSDGQLHISVNDQRNQKIAQFRLDQAFMLDMQLTQRLLLNVPSYEGKAGMDTFVISIRQPLFSGMF